MTNQNLQFRIATLEDAPQLQQLVQAAFRAEDSRKDWTADMALGASFTISVDEIASKISTPDSGMLMAEDKDGHLVACVGIWRRDADLARLSLLAVDQTAQRGGVGRQVLLRAEDHCHRAWGVGRFGLNALSSRQQLISWYCRCGYQETGETTPFPFQRTDSVGLKEELYFVELEKRWEAAVA